MKNDQKFDSDQRRPRIPYRVNVVMIPRDSGERHDGEARDLSTGGMFIETILPLEPGTVFDIEIPILPLSYRGAVRVLRRHVGEEGSDEFPGLAVEWVDMSTHQKRMLFRQIEDHVRNGGKVLSGNLGATVESRPAGRESAAAEIAAPDHTQLILRLSLAVAFVLIALVLLLLP